VSEGWEDWLPPPSLVADIRAPRKGCHRAGSGSMARTSELCRAATGGATTGRS
jgi:hypothetical protein